MPANLARHHVPIEPYCPQCGKVGTMTHTIIHCQIESEEYVEEYGILVSFEEDSRLLFQGVL